MRIRIHLTNKESGTESHIFCVVDTSIGWVGGKAQAGLREVVFAARLTVRETHRIAYEGDRKSGVAPV